MDLWAYNTGPAGINSARRGVSAVPPQD